MNEHNPTQRQTVDMTLTGLACEPDAQGHCITCSDAALPALVIEVDQALVWVEVAGQRVEVDTSLVDEVAVGDRLLVHGGVALAHLGAAEELIP